MTHALGNRRARRRFTQAGERETATPARSARRVRRPWGDYALRVLACALLFAGGFSLLAGSPFALRMRDDIPSFVPGLSGVHSLALLLAFLLGFLPLLFGKRYLGAFLVSSFLVAGIGGYWWSLITWDELVTESDFHATTAPDWWRYFQVSTPLIAAVLYVVASRASRMRAEYRNRGADPEEVSHAAAGSFLAGMGSLVVTLALAAGLWQLLASGALTGRPAWVPTGAPAVLLAAAAIGLAAWLLSSRRRGPDGVDAAGVLRRPWTAAKGRAARARSRARRSPS